MVALYAFDHELARARRVASNPLVAEMRLVWWREVLDEILAGLPVRAHPTARALAEAVARRNLTREPLDDMIEGRIEALDGDVAGVERAGGGVARAAVQILGNGPSPARGEGIVPELGAIWARVVNARGNRSERELGQRLNAARGCSRAIPAAQFPAVLHLALASPELRGHRPSGLNARLRLVWASLTGRL